MTYAQRTVPSRLRRHLSRARALVGPLRRTAAWSRPAVLAVLGPIARRGGLDQDPATRAFLRRYARELAVPAGGQVVLVSATRPARTANTYAAVFPGAQVTLLSLLPLTVTDRALLRRNVAARQVSDIEQAYQALLRQPGPDVIIDSGSREHPAFRRLFLRLTDGGCCVIMASGARGGEAEAPETGWSLLQRLLEMKRWSGKQLSRLEPIERELASAIDQVVACDGIAIVRRTGTHLAKTTTKTADRIVTARYGRDAVTRPVVLAPEAYRSRAALWTNNPGLAQKRFPPVLRVPELAARVHTDVVCAPKQVVAKDDLLLPASYHQPWRKPPRCRGTTDAGPDFARVALTPAEELQGTYFHLDNEFAGHYGHFITQDLTKLWAWRAAKRRYPQLKLLVSAAGSAPALAPFQYELLRGFGIEAAEIHVITGPVRVQRLVTATQTMQNPHFAGEPARAVWSEIRDALTAGRSADDVPEKVFVGRGAGLGRRCTNGDRVEELFVRHGFEIVYPERLSIPDQLHHFAEARVTAGYAGSALLNMMFARRPGTRIVVGSETYRACNEYLLAALLGDDLHYYWCAPHASPAAIGRAAFHADFEFDFARDGDSLTELLKSL